MSKHTPGPWRLSTYPGMPGQGDIFSRDNDGAFRIVRGEGDDLEPVATAIFKGEAKRGQAWKTEDPVGLANARLIAAAPELLEAAQELVRWYYDEFAPGGFHEALRPVKAVIRKATGNTP